MQRVPAERSLFAEGQQTRASCRLEQPRPTAPEAKSRVTGLGGTSSLLFVTTTRSLLSYL